MHPVLTVIPARGGSKGLPGKNLRKLAGLPLIAHSILCARMCEGLERIVVSTDDPGIAAVAREYGADAPFLRPPELASDTAAMMPVLQHAVAEMERLDGTRYASVLLLDPTSPGRLPADVANSLALLDEDPLADGVVGVSEPDFNPYWHAVVEDGPYMKDLFASAGTFERRQDLPPVYRINATLYLWRRDSMLSAENWRSGRHRMLVVPEDRSFHIDTAAQFDHAELLLAHGFVTFPWLTGANANAG